MFTFELGVDCNGEHELLFHCGNHTVVINPGSDDDLWITVEDTNEPRQEGETVGARYHYKVVGNALVEQQ